MEFEKFAITFGIMAEYFGARPSEGLTKIYYESFRKWKIEDFNLACQKIMDGRVFNGLPKIAEIKEMLYGKVDDLVALAWESFMKSLRDIGPWESVVFEDGAIAHAIEAMGGWQIVNQWTIDECRMRRKEFESIYLANLRRGNIQAKKLIGLFEAHNSLNIEWEKFTPKVRTIPSQIKEIEIKKLKLLS